MAKPIAPDTWSQFVLILLMVLGLFISIVSWIAWGTA